MANLTPLPPLTVPTDFLKAELPEDIAFNSYQTQASVHGNLSYIRDHITNAAKSINSEIWENALGLSPQDVFNLWGTNAGTIWNLFLSSVNLVNSIEKDSLSFDYPNTVTVNDDGSVTLSDLNSPNIDA